MPARRARRHFADHGVPGCDPTVRDAIPAGIFLARSEPDTVTNHDRRGGPCGRQGAHEGRPYNRRTPTTTDGHSAMQDDTGSKLAASIEQSVAERFGELLPVDPSLAGLDELARIAGHR